MSHRTIKVSFKKNCHKQQDIIIYLKQLKYTCQYTIQYTYDKNNQYTYIHIKTKVQILAILLNSKFQILNATISTPINLSQTRKRNMSTILKSPICIHIMSNGDQISIQVTHKPSRYIKLLQSQHTDSVKHVIFFSFDKVQQNRYRRERDI